jgi:cell division septation protein DedD
MEESRRERIKRASARRRGREFSYETGRGLIPREKANRKFFYIAAGSILVALVAFLCGVQMGKSLSEVRISSEIGPPVKDQKGKAPPFRVMEKGKESSPGQEARDRAADPGEGTKEKEAGSPGPSTKASNGGASAAAAEKNSAPPEEEKPPPPKAKYSLQVAALNNPAEAQDLVDQLKKKGYDAYQVTGTAAAKGTLHRVRIGHFQSLQEARQFALAFEKKENRKPIIASIQNP